MVNKLKGIIGIVSVVILIYFVSSGNTLVAEERQDRLMQLEVSSEVVLRPGQPRIVGATQKDEAIFLIMGVDI